MNALTSSVGVQNSCRRVLRYSARHLLGSLWEARDFGALAGAARHLLDIMPAIGEAHLALACVADQEGDTESLVEHFAYAMAYTDQPRLPHVGALDWGSMIERSGARAETRAIELLGEHVFQLNEQQLSPEEGVLPGLPLIEALDRIAKYNSRGTISARTVHALRWASERAWDRDDLRTVVVLVSMCARCSTAPDLRKEAASPSSSDGSQRF